MRVTIFECSNNYIKSIKENSTKGVVPMFKHFNALFLYNINVDSSAVKTNFIVFCPDNPI